MELATIPASTLGMDTLKDALKRQYEAALLMLREAVDLCPEDLWVSGDHPRTFWRIAYHAAGYAHLYLYNNLDDWKKWERARNDCAILEGDAPEVEPYTAFEMLQFIDLIRAEVGPRLDAMNLDEPHCGFPWYPNVTRFELQVLSMRHLHGHLGQLHELLIARDLDVEWIGQPSAIPV